MKTTKESDYSMSADYAAARGVPAVKVSLRCAILIYAAKKDFIWYLQGLSLREGGFKQLARDLIEMFPERLGFPGQKNLPKTEFAELSARALRVHDKNVWPGHDPLSGFRDYSIEEFLLELCVNPRVQFSLPGIDDEMAEFENRRAMDSNSQLREYHFVKAELSYFADIIGALVEYRTRHAKTIRENFHLTAIGKKIWETLDYALTSQNMVLMDGLEGRGKTEAVKAWCELHPGHARFVSLKGVTNRITAFREIAFALGITYAYGRTGPEMQSRIEDVLNRSKIMLVIDEAHFLFNQTRQMTARPELIDWIDTAVCNRGVPVALVTTPQFIACMARAKNQVEWNFNQFRRRVKRWVKLPDKNSEADIAAVARKVFKNSTESVIKKIVGYALLSKRDLSAVGDVAAECRAMGGIDKLSNVSVEQVHRAITEFLIPSDQAFKVALVEAESAQRKTRRRPAPALPDLGAAADTLETIETPPAPAIGRLTCRITGAPAADGTAFNLLPESHRRNVTETPLLNK